MAIQMLAVAIGIHGAPMWQRRVGGRPVSATPRNNREIEVHVENRSPNTESWEVLLMPGQGVIARGAEDDEFEFVCTVAVDPTDGVMVGVSPATGMLPVLPVHVFRRRLA